jgi:twitching motility protein PilT
LLRINGRLVPVEVPPLKPDELTQMLTGILSPRQKEKLEERMSVDTGYGVSGLARFRCNIYMQRGTIAAAFRRIPFDISPSRSGSARADG